MLDARFHNRMLVVFFGGGNLVGDGGGAGTGGRGDYSMYYVAAVGVMEEQPEKRVNWLVKGVG